jgi:tetratricopeptide (TPR) repeat protein
MIRPKSALLRQLARMSAFALGGGLMATASTAHAQAGFAVVQPLPDPNTDRLSDALQTLSRSPRSLDALIAAAEASLGLDDLDAAGGFIQRAEAVAPGDGRVMAARASWLARRQQPVEALRLFAEAEKLGALGLTHVADRGLAYDLVGDNARAQKDYAVVLSAGANPLITRRLALSQAIAGDQRASEATLLPLLQHRDLAAYRTRAFALAILGKPDEAVSIAETMLPDRLSGRIGPYLRYMPRLTRAQQAAAANLGAFPQAAEIGRDAPAIAAYSGQSSAPPAPVRTADARLVPTGAPLGSPRNEDNATPIVRAAVQPSQASPPPQPAAASSGTRELAAVTSRPAPVAAAPAEAVVPPDPRDLASAFAEFSLSSRAAPVVADGAVDITKIKPRREAPPAPPPPPKPVIPSRQWVQIATGRDTGALAFDWRRIKRTAGALLDHAEPHIAKWGQTNRLVVGPLDNAREADKLVTELKKKDIDSFRFTSDQGEEVKPLD